MGKGQAALIAAAVVVAGVLVAAAVVLTRPETRQPDLTAGQDAAVETQRVKGQFHVYDNRWFDTIPDTEWNRCNGQPECDGYECYGTGVADGLGYGTPVTVVDRYGVDVALDEVRNTWGWKSGPTRGSCVLYWQVDVPTTETGPLRVVFDDDDAWSVKFTLQQMEKFPHNLDLIGIGDLNS